MKREKPPVCAPPSHKIRGIMNNDELRLAPMAGTYDVECVVCLHKTFNRVMDGDWFAPMCSERCLQTWPRVRDLLADRDEWRRQSEDALTCWRRDSDTLAEAIETGKEWKRLHDERNRLRRAAEDQLDAVWLLLAAQGCDCECGHGGEDHDEACDLCLTCRIAAVMSERGVRTS